MEKDFKLIATTILTHLGGASNVDSATNCITRLRVNVKNPELIKLEELKKSDSVMQVINDGKIVQVVLGPGIVKKVADQFYPLLKETTSATPTPTPTPTPNGILNIKI